MQNKTIIAFTRFQIKEGLAKLDKPCHRTFKLMYARDNGKRSVEDAVAMQINDVVDIMEVEKLDWALSQVQASLQKAGL